jgi:hypothetical protein
MRDKIFWNILACIHGKIPFRLIGRIAAGSGGYQLIAVKIVTFAKF